LDGPEETWVIDPAAQRAYFTELARSRRVTAVFLSHFHEDHQRYNYLFPQAAFFGPALEEDAFRSIKGVFRHMGLKDPEFRRHWQETLERQFHLRPIQRFKPHFPGQLFQLGELTLEVLPAPGHTPGHSCFAIPELDLLYLADVDLTSFGPWYGDATSDLEAYIDTLKSLRPLKAGVYLTAHEQGVFNRQEFMAGIDYFLEVIARRDERIIEALRTPYTLGRLAARRLIYGRPREPLFVYDHMERQMLAKHLGRLMQRGAVQRLGRRWVAG
jgi:glyoxylase-like metal-dependent hydrolase (beta-lactamase superfamily II)